MNAALRMEINESINAVSKKRVAKKCNIAIRYMDSYRLERDKKKEEKKRKEETRHRLYSPNTLRPAFLTKIQ